VVAFLPAALWTGKLPSALQVVAAPGAKIFDIVQVASYLESKAAVGRRPPIERVRE